MVFMRGTLAQYRMAMLTFLGISIPLVTIQIDYVLQYSKGAQLNRVAANSYVAGYIGLVIVQYIWVLVLGSEPRSYLGHFAQDDTSALSSIVEPHFYNEKLHIENADGLQDFSQVLVPPSATSSHIPAQQHAIVHPSPAQQQPTHVDVAPYPPSSAGTTSKPPQSANIDQKDRVEAIHAYQANPQDPNELSFEKNEVMEVIDRKGNWWQARKMDGTVGIIPSNYFRPVQQ
ncbi:hypothetical protein BC940DRAFT_306946 [Gongronella butleri]|nr:hypothetical protein BC940DRAFT_306946 [Gongronella butleri]